MRGANAPAVAVPRIALTAGEPAGIGPDLVLAAAARDRPFALTAIASRAVLAERAAQLGVSLAFDAFDGDRAALPHRGGRLEVIDVPAATAVTPGLLDRANAAHVIAMLTAASDGALAGRFAAIVTGPVHKGVINDAGIAFRGHTEFFAARADRKVSMLLIAGSLRVALATTHLPLSAVPAALDRDALTAAIERLHAALVDDFAIAQPRIAVLGLNPHAGEDGHLGREEIDTIAPAIAAARARGIDADGPLAADTAFVAQARARYDAYLAMFHDQGLPVLKALGFGGAVNVTVGLPYVRTSVDHGTALDVAASGRADPSSLDAALGLAHALIGTRGAEPGDAR